MAVKTGLQEVTNCCVLCLCISLYSSGVHRMMPHLVCIRSKHYMYVGSWETPLKTVHDSSFCTQHRPVQGWFPDRLEWWRHIFWGEGGGGFTWGGWGQTQSASRCVGGMGMHLHACCAAAGWPHSCPTQTRAHCPKSCVLLCIVPSLRAYSSWCNYHAESCFIEITWACS